MQHVPANLLKSPSDSIYESFKNNENNLTV